MHLTCILPKDGDGRVSAEEANVLLHPLQGKLLIHDACGRRREKGERKTREREIQRREGVRERGRDRGGRGRAREWEGEGGRGMEGEAEG